jgi:hypothetical protein
MADTLLFPPLKHMAVAYHNCPVTSLDVISTHAFETFSTSVFNHTVPVDVAASAMIFPSESAHKAFVDQLPLGVIVSHVFGFGVFDNPNTKALLYPAVFAPLLVVTITFTALEVFCDGTVTVISVFVFASIVACTVPKKTEVAFAKVVPCIVTVASWFRGTL